MKVFICMPYGDHLPVSQRLANTHAAMDVFERLASIGGIYPYCPHLSHFQHEMYPRTRNFWLALSREYLAICDCLLAIGGPTDGMRTEMTEARRIWMPTFLGATYEEAVAKLLEAHKILF